MHLWLEAYSFHFLSIFRCLDRSGSSGSDDLMPMSRKFEPPEIRTFLPCFIPCFPLVQLVPCALMCLFLYLYCWKEWNRLCISKPVCTSLSFVPFLAFFSTSLPLCISLPALEPFLACLCALPCLHFVTFVACLCAIPCLSLPAFVHIQAYFCTFPYLSFVSFFACLCSTFPCDCLCAFHCLLLCNSLPSFDKPETWRHIISYVTAPCSSYLEYR